MPASHRPPVYAPLSAPSQALLLRIFPRSAPPAWWLGAAALLCLGAGPSRAQVLESLPPPIPLSQAEDRPPALEFRAGQRIEHDSNVYRLSDSADATPLTGSSKRADTYGVTTLGVKLDQTYSLQRLELDINAQAYRYQNFSALDFTALNYAAAWRWSLTPRFHGSLTADQREFVDNTVDVQSSSEVNRRTERRALFEAEYEIGAAWRALAGVFERSLKNSLPQTYEADATATGGELGARYVWPSGNSAAYRYKAASGDYSGRVPTLLAPNEFSDREHELSFEMLPVAGSSVRGRLAHLDRRHDGFEARDFSGLVGEVSGRWALTGKTRIEAGVLRELGSYQTSTASYYEGERLYVSPVWKPTEKSAVRLRLDQGERRYKGGIVLPPVGRRDTTTLTALSLEWEPLRLLRLVASFQQDKRKSNTAGYDYLANVLGVSAQLSF